MCRSIRSLHNLEPSASADEIHEASLQYVRKLTGMRKPGSANEAAFRQAVDAVAAATSELLGALVATTLPRDRDSERGRARARWERRAGAPSTPPPAPGPTGR